MKPARVPPFATDIIQMALSSLDGMEFTGIDSCPSCGGADLHGYDRKTKKFAVLRQQDGERTVSVRVKRFRCSTCGALCYADEPFYAGTRIGSPVVDLFCSLSAAIPPSRAARIIDAMGIVVDRTTWKNYRGVSSDGIPVVDIFGMRLPVCIARLSDLATRADNPDPADVITALGYPSRTRRATGPSSKNSQGGYPGEP